MVKIMLVDSHMLMRRIVKEVIEKEEGLEVIAELGTSSEAEAQATHLQPDLILMDLDLPDCDPFELITLLLTCSPSSRIVIFTASHLGQHLIVALQKGAIGYITKDIEPAALIHALRCAIHNDFYLPAHLAAHVLSFMRIRAQMSDVHLRSHAADRSLYNDYASLEPFISSRLRRSTIAYRIATRYTPPHLTPPLPSLSSEGPDPTLVTNPPVRCRPLTEREREILDLMRRGRKNKEIAGELCIAESTVHKHVQNIFEKLHARNRTEAIFLTGVATDDQVPPFVEPDSVEPDPSATMLTPIEEA